MAASVAWEGWHLWELFHTLTLDGPELGILRVRGLWGPAGQHELMGPLRCRRRAGSCLTSSPRVLLSHSWGTSTVRGACRWDGGGVGGQAAKRATLSSTWPAPGPAQLPATRGLWTMETEVDEGRRIPDYRRAAEEPSRPSRPRVVAAPGWVSSGVDGVAKPHM